MYLRQAGHYWTQIVALSSAVDILHSSQAPEEAMQRYRMLNQQIRVAGLQDVHKMGKLIDGESLCSAYGIKTGPILKHLDIELINF